MRGIRITIKVVAFLVKKLGGLSAMGRSLPDGWQAGASGGKVRKLEGSKVERVSGYGPHPFGMNHAVNTSGGIFNLMP